MRAVGGSAVEKLLSIGSDALAPKPIVGPAVLEAYPLGPELFRVLVMKNGFYAFESALHVFPLSSPGCMSLEEWNSDSLWRNEYRDLADGLLFFAEDALQDQFCLSANGVVHFKAETGSIAPFAVSIAEWADRLLQNYPAETGWTIASQWQAANGPLPVGKRLMPKTPFFLGGKHSIENIWAGDAVEGMRFKADLALQTRDIPDGGSIRFVVGKKPQVQ